MGQDADEILFTVTEWEGEYDDGGVAGVMPSKSFLHVIRPDGTGLRRVTEHNAGFGHYSPDGTWIYFQSAVEGTTHIGRCRPDGSELTHLTRGHTLGTASYGFALSRDGRQVCFCSQGSDVVRVAVMNADGSNPRIVAPDLGYHYMASFSPDGKSLACACPLPGGYQLIRLDMDGGNRVWLTPDLPHSGNPWFTPDGRTILFYNHGDGELYRVDATGGNLKPLTRGNKYTRFHLSRKDTHGSSDVHSISPDGTRVAWIGCPAGMAQVFTMKIDGTEPRFLTHRPAPCAWVTWSPDQRRLAFVSFPDQEARYPQLFVMDATGGEPRQLTTMNGAVFWNFWKPCR